MNAPANPNKALWEKGDFTRIADTMRESGEALMQRLGITEGLKVLDLGCGDGTTALPAANLGADVVGVDIARNLVEAGNRRAAEQGLNNLKFQEGDASNLEQLPEKAFDLVVEKSGLRVEKYSETSEYTMPANYYLRNMGIDNSFMRLLGRAFYSNSKYLAKNKILAVLTRSK